MNMRQLVKRPRGRPKKIVLPTKENKKISSRSGNKGGSGGAQPGSGAAGSKKMITVANILAALRLVDDGRPYEEILVVDFQTARMSGNQELVFKYHQLIMSKLVANISKIEVTDTSETIKAKQMAFVEAFTKLTENKEE